MLDFKKILVPYDGSNHAKKALNQPISLAQCSDGAELEMGEPVPMLLYLAGEIGADLIITGSRGRGALKSLFMGSVSSGILKNAKCPVFIIK